MALDPRKVTLCWPNRIEDASLSGGNWEVSLPLSLVQDRVFAVRAQSVDATEASTQFDATLPQGRPVQVIALAAHNLSADAQYRVRLYADAAQTELLWDSGQQPVWPAVYSTAELEWEYDNFWAGTLDEESRSQYTPLTTIIADDMQMTTSLKVELFDTANPDGYVRLGRVFIASAWQPDYNASYGIQHGFDSATQVSEAGDRTEYFERKRLKRSATMAFDHLSEPEAFQRLYGMQRTEDISGEVLYAFGLSSTPENFSRTFIARQQQLDPLSQPYFATHSHNLNLLEIL